MNEVTLIPTCDANVYFCPENHKMYVSVLKNKLIRYISLVEFLENPKKFILLIK